MIVASTRNRTTSASPSFVQLAASGNATTATVTSNTTSGNVLLAFCRGGSGSYATSVSDTQGNTWVEVGHTSTSNTITIYRCVLSTALTTSDTITPVSSGGTLTVAVYEYTGVDTTTPIHASTVSSGTSATTCTTSTITVTDQDVLLVSGLTANNDISTPTKPTNYTLRSGLYYAGAGSAVSADYAPGATGTPSATWSWSASASWGAGLVALNPA